MADRRRSPLADVVLPPGLREVRFRAQLDVRLDRDDGAARAAVESVIGRLPLEPNTVAGGPAAAVLWLGPDEWLVVGGPDEAAAATLEGQIRAALAGAPEAGPVAIVDVSANRTIVELDHPESRAILAGGCSIDLHPRAFGPGRCAQTLVARAQVILWQVDDRPTIRLLVRPSFAAYLAAWLTDAIPG